MSFHFPWSWPSGINLHIQAEIFMVSLNHLSKGNRQVFTDPWLVVRWWFCGRSLMHEIWGSSIAMPSWPHPSRWCTGQIQDATNRQKMPGTAFAWTHGRQAKGMGEIWILLPPEVSQYWCQNSEKRALLFYLAVKLWTITQAIINSEGPSIAVSILHRVQDSKTVAIKKGENLASS